MAKLLLPFLLTFASLVRADVWSVTTADFQSRQGELKAFGADGVRLAAPTGDGADGGERVVPLADFLEATRRDAPRGQKGRFVLHLSNGDALVGEPGSVKDEQLRWRGAFLGETPVPLRRLVALTRADHPARPAGERPTEDTVRLTNGDVVTGIVSDLAADRLTIATPDPVEIPLDSVTQVRFASAGDEAVAAPRERTFRVNLIDGSALTATTIAFDGTGWTITAGADSAPRPLDAAAVASVEQVNGPVSWLSTRGPSENVQTPFLDTPWPAQMNRTARGQPIRFGSRTFERGIGVHAYSRLSWDLEPGRYKALRLQYALDGDLPYADVTVRVKLDGDRVAHEAEHVRAGTLSDVVLIELNDAKKLTLEVDYGGGYDVQDRFNWIEPALLRDVPRPPTPATVPTTVPTTQP